MLDSTRQPAPTEIELPARFAATASRVDALLAADLDRWLPDVPAKLAEAIRYALMAPGKRLRPVLLLWCAELVDSAVTYRATHAAVGIEMLHTYSLVHDDLPAMDDDDLRRGRATCHVVFGEGHAILVGDALLTRAFEVIAHGDTSARQTAALVRTLARCGGAVGMIGGQSEDLRYENAQPDLAAVQDIHQRKTAALFEAACRMGAIAAGADTETENAFATFGRSLGVAFQIADDLLDEVGQAAQVGKAVGKDRAAGKLTYPRVAGLDASRQAADDWMARANATLDRLVDILPAANRELLGDLRTLCRYVIERTR